MAVSNEPTPTQGYGVSMGNNLMIDSRVGELISLRDSICCARDKASSSNASKLARVKGVLDRSPKSQPLFRFGRPVIFIKQSNN